MAGNARSEATTTSASAPRRRPRPGLAPSCRVFSRGHLSASSRVARGNAPPGGRPWAHRMRTQAARHIIQNGGCAREGVRRDTAPVENETARGIAHDRHLGQRTRCGSPAHRSRRAGGRRGAAGGALGRLPARRPRALDHGACRAPRARPHAGRARGPAAPDPRRRRVLRAARRADRARRRPGGRPRADRQAGRPGRSPRPRGDRDGGAAVRVGQAAHRRRPRAAPPGAAAARADGFRGRRGAILSRACSPRAAASTSGASSASVRPSTSRPATRRPPIRATASSSAPAHTCSTSVATTAAPGASVSPSARTAAARGSSGPSPSARRVARRRSPGSSRKPSSGATSPPAERPSSSIAASWPESGSRSDEEHVDDAQRAAALDPLERADEPALELGAGAERVDHQLDPRPGRRSWSSFSVITSSPPVPAGAATPRRYAPASAAASPDRGDAEGPAPPLRGRRARSASGGERPDVVADARVDGVAGEILDARGRVTV